MRKQNLVLKAMYLLRTCPVMSQISDAITHSVVLNALVFPKNTDTRKLWQLLLKNCVKEKQSQYDSLKSHIIQLMPMHLDLSASWIPRGKELVMLCARHWKLHIKEMFFKCNLIGSNTLFSFRTVVILCWHKNYASWRMAPTSVTLPFKVFCELTCHYIHV